MGLLSWFQGFFKALEKFLRLLKGFVRGFPCVVKIILRVLEGISAIPTGVGRVSEGV